MSINLYEIMTTIILTGIISFLVGVLLTNAIKNTPDPLVPNPPLFYNTCPDYKHHHFTDCQIEVMKQNAFYRGRWEALNEGINKVDRNVMRIMTEVELLKK